MMRLLFVVLLFCSGCEINKGPQPRRYVVTITSPTGDVEKSFFIESGYKPDLRVIQEGVMGVRTQPQGEEWFAPLGWLMTVEAAP